ncbi:hypothetical protein HZI73_12540 [Vallitalea pronyensis]|uniref:Uncharacterized protein n=1 Tax=Vallitalea pronyensis TaxID=1348613 RepID=A0A8J8MJY9_9FIRM|nr:hypothetical protein [Vallitalea pronyensis]QUI23064.1 hypothetical protein HZI73_12540 [Vallitalea pronyensis]
MINKKCIKRISLCITMMFLMVCFNNSIYAGVPIYNQEIEPNNTRDDANIIQLGQPFSGQISDSNDVDYFSYTPDERKKLTFLFIDQDGTTFNYYIIDRTDDNKLIHYGDISGTITKEFSFEADHECIIMIKSSNGNNSRYEASLSGETSYESVTIDSKESEFNNTIECVNKLSTEDALISAKISDSNDEDYFMFTAKNSGSKNFVFYPGSDANFYFFVYDMITHQYVYEGYLDTLGQSKVIPFNAQQYHHYRVYVTVNGSADNESYHFKCWNN